VKDDALGLSAAKKFQRLIEHRASSLGGGFHFLKPYRNVQLIPLGIAQNGIALFLERYAFGPLFDRGNTDVADVALHCGV